MNCRLLAQRLKGKVKRMVNMPWQAWNSILVIALSIGFLVHLCLIAINGTVEIQEPRVTILIAEFCLFIGLLISGCISLRKSIKVERLNRERNKESGQRED